MNLCVCVCVFFCVSTYACRYAGPYLRTGPRGPGPGRQIFRGSILKKLRLKYGMREKRLSTREKFKGDLRSILKTMLVPSFLVTTLLALEGAEAIA